jgi:2,4-dienoyl-CoA reductase-like NADH-dependent reductase (Old Yellow Enzyme family)
MTSLYDPIIFGDMKLGNRVFMAPLIRNRAVYADGFRHSKVLQGAALTSRGVMEPVESAKPSARDLAATL